MLRRGLRSFTASTSTTTPALSLAAVRRSLLTGWRGAAACGSAGGIAASVLALVKPRFLASTAASTTTPTTGSDSNKTIKTASGNGTQYCATHISHRCFDLVVI